MKQVFRARRATPAQQGLTLIGQMMVLLVAGALGAVALSSWLDVQVRERATEAYNQLEAIKPAAENSAASNAANRGRPAWRWPHWAKRRQAAALWLAAGRPAPRTGC